MKPHEQKVIVRLKSIINTIQDLTIEKSEELLTAIISANKASIRKKDLIKFISFI